MPKRDIGTQKKQKRDIKKELKEIELLDEKDREYYKLNKFGGMSAAEISNTFNDNINSVKSRIFRAQSKIRKISSPYIKEINKY